MLKQYKKTLILASLVLLIPIVVGLILWDKLPDSIPIHWGINGEPDNWSGKGFAVFGMPAIMLAVQWICAFACTADPKYKNYNPKMMKLSLWICPCVGLILSCMVYPAALGYSISSKVIAPLIVGVLFIVMGNLLPKCRQTYTMGIKLPWTLASEENWNATHRFGGKVWVIGGILCLPCAFWGNFWVLMVILAAMVILPTVYSYMYYRKHKEDPANEQ